MTSTARLARLLKVAALFGLGFASALVAQTFTDSPQRVELKRADLSGAPGMEVAYVLQGASIQVPGKDPATLAAGATLLNLRDIRHGGFKVVGEVPLKLFTVHVVDKGQPLYYYTK